MSIILYGVTSGGTSVPIEVTDEGKLVVDTSNFNTDEFIKQGDDIQTGSITAAGNIATTGDYIFVDGGSDGYVALYSAGETGTSTKIVTYGSASNNDAINVRDGDGNTNFKVTDEGSLTASAITTIADAQFASGRARFEANGNLELKNGSDTVASISAADGSASLADEFLIIPGDGSISAVGGKCGFTPDGELYFWSRGARYKAVVQAGNMMAEAYTRATELQEKAAKLREPRTQDIVSED